MESALLPVAHRDKAAWLSGLVLVLTASASACRRLPPAGRAELLGSQDLKAGALHGLEQPALPR